MLIENLAEQIASLAGVATLTVDAEADKPEHAATAVAAGVELFVPLEGLVDFEAERARVDKELGKARADLGKLEKKLANEGFLAKAAPEIIEKDGLERRASSRKWSRWSPSSPSCPSAVGIDGRLGDAAGDRGESLVPFSYEDAVAALEDALRFGTHPSLDTITALCEALGRPQDALRAIQVAGTNGKTSVTWMTEAILSAHGMRAASYTSPHLNRYTERIRLGGSDCSPDEFAAAVEAVLIASRNRGLNEPTEFEILTAAALWLFRERGVDVAVLEVGMGGRWDATSVVTPDGGRDHRCRSRPCRASR